MIVVDASVIVTALADDGADGDRVRTRLSGERLVAPHVLDVEAASAWRRLVSADHLDDRRAALAIEDLGDLPLKRVAHTHLMVRCWELRHNLTVYDAAYVALAEALDADLITADHKLAASPGPRCRIEVL